MGKTLPDGVNVEKQRLGISMTNDYSVTNTEKLEQQKSGMKTKLKLKQLKDQVIVITGATSGIGLVTARMAAEQGAKVVAAARNEDALKELADELKDKGHDAIWVRADVGKEEDVNRIAETAISTFGRFDTWVKNAAVSIFGHAMDVTVEDMKRMFDANFWGLFTEQERPSNTTPAEACRTH